jgi:hypothetical protein
MKTTEQLITEANAAIAELRSRGAVPFNLTISENVDIELRISSEGEGVFRTSEAVRADSWMHSVFLIGGQARDGRSHTYGMSVCRNATLHHQIQKPELVSGFFSSARSPSIGGLSRTCLASVASPSRAFAPLKTSLFSIFALRSRERSRGFLYINQLVTNE